MMLPYGYDGEPELPGEPDLKYQKMEQAYINAVKTIGVMRENLMKSVWLVDNGEDYDLVVLGVFSSQSNAELYAKKCGGRIVERPLDDAPFDLWRKGLNAYSAVVSRDGKNLRVFHSSPRAKNEVMLQSSYTGATGILWGSYLQLWGWFYSKEEAKAEMIKARDKFIVEGRWTEDPTGARYMEWRVEDPEWTE